MPKKEVIQRMFDDIAPEYDALNHLMSLNIDRSWRKRAIRKIPRPGNGKKIRVLDLACGTGDFAIAVARALGEDCIVTGADISTGMLDVMREKIESASLGDRIGIVEADCCQLPFPDGSFDVETLAFGIRNFEDRDAGLKEALRVLRPGGKLIILELSVPSNAVLRVLYEFYFTRILPLVCGGISGNKAAYKYLPASVLNFPGRKEFTAQMLRCGFREVEHTALTFGICRMYCGVKGRD